MAQAAFFLLLHRNGNAVIVIWDGFSRQTIVTGVSPNSIRIRLSTSYRMSGRFSLTTISRAYPCYQAINPGVLVKQHSILLMAGVHMVIGLDRAQSSQ